VIITSINQPKKSRHDTESAGKRNKFAMRIILQRANARKLPIDSETRRRAFDIAELYREELGRHWQPRGLTKRDRLQITRRYTRAWS
jgi:hypothetical protein